MYEDIIKLEERIDRQTKHSGHILETDAILTLAKVNLLIAKQLQLLRDELKYSLNKDE